MPDPQNNPQPASLVWGVLRAFGGLGLVIVFSILLMITLAVGIGIVTGTLFGAGTVLAMIVPFLPPAVLLIAPVIVAYLIYLPFGGAFQPALMFRYLRRKLIPMFAILAVTLCVAMVIIVASVMGGFLEMVRTSGKSLTGDVSLMAGQGGFARYPELIEALEARDEVHAASPVIVGYGLLKLPGRYFGFDSDRIETVQVFGIEGRSYAEVTAYRDKLYWTQERAAADRLLSEVFDGKDPREMALDMAARWQRRDSEQTPQSMPVMVPGIEINPGNRRTIAGDYEHPIPLPGLRLPLTLVPITESAGLVDPSVREFTVINEFHSGLWDVDSSRVYIPFAEAQAMLLMDAAPLVDPEDPTTIIGEKPARTNELHIAAVPGISADQLLQVVIEVYDELELKYDELPPRPWMSIQTWEQRQARYLSAVENEKGMITMLFAIISFVAVVMVAVVFYMIVLDKTRDIGILRALGASQYDIASIFLGYGMAVGVIGSTIGTCFAWLFVTNINDIHTWLGTEMPIHGFLAGGALVGLILGLIISGIVIRSARMRAAQGWRYTAIISLPLALIGFGLAWLYLNQMTGFAEFLRANFAIVIWNKQVYFFDRIPDRVDPMEVTVFVVVAIGASIIGALLPAIKAARVHPVHALRYE